MFFGGNTVSFTPDKDIPSLQGKVILVTGGNIGLGRQAILEYARHSPRQIWLGARSLDKAKAAVDEIRNQVGDAPIKLLQMDLSSFESIKRAAKTFIAESDRLDILMLNAGVMACAPGLTADGYEIQFGINHMGHALLTKLLLPVLNKTAESSPDSDVRIISLSSVGHSRGPKEGIAFDSLKTTASDMGAFARYGQSKFANVLFARHLAKLHPHFTVAAVHPGTVRTNLMSNASGLSAALRLLGPLVAYFLSPVDQGARNHLWASVSKDVKSGEYYEPVGVADRCHELGKDDDLAKKLWDWTEEELDKALSDKERPSKPSLVTGNL